MDKRTKDLTGREPLRVPQGWTEQSRAFVIQLERILTDIYHRIRGIKAVVGISRSGTTFTATRSDGSKFTFDQQDTTYDQISRGSDAGLAPGLPTGSGTTKYLREDGSWQVPPDTQRTNAQIVNLIYPVGSIYMSVNSTNPGTLFGGTWAQLKDRFLLGVGDTYKTVNATGGAASLSYTPAGKNTGGAVSNTTLTTDQIPSHSHKFTGSAVTSGGISANHTHTGTSGNPSANHTHSGPSHTHDISTANNWTSKGSHAIAKTDKEINTTASAAAKASGTGATGTVSAWHTHTTTTGNQSAGHTHSVTAAGTNANTGGGKAHGHGFTQPTFTGTAATLDKMPPYLVVYMWKRTA